MHTHKKDPWAPLQDSDPVGLWLNLGMGIIKCSVGDYEVASPQGPWLVDHMETANKECLCSTQTLEI